MTIERTKDYGLIRKVMTHPRIWPHITDDGVVPIEQWKPIEHESILYLLVRDDSELLGVVMFVPRNSIELGCHHFFLPCAWGEKARRVAALVAAWIWDNTECQRITGATPAYNRLAVRFAGRVGMKQYGVNPNSYLKFGRLWDQVLTGMDRPTGGAKRGT